MQISYHPDGGGMTRTHGNVTSHRRWGTGGGGGGGGGGGSNWQAAPGQFADALSGVFSSGNEGMGLLGAGYGGVAQGYGSAAQAIANERSNFYGANAMAEAARQASLGNIGSAGLAAYGGAANNALQSQALQSSAYMRALSDMMAANQGALSGLGRAQVVAGSLGGGDYQATGKGGPIASGSGGGLPGASGNASLQALLAGDAAYRSQLRDGYDAGLPGETLADILSGVRTLTGDNQAGVFAGMNQFYATQNDPANRADFGGVLSGLGSALGGLGGLRSGIQSNTQAGASALTNLFGDSWGDRGTFDSPLERLQKQRAAMNFRQQM